MSSRPIPEERPTGSVLVVDDEEGIREFARDCLAGEGHRVHVAVDGAEALALLRERPFDVVLLDLAMPGEHGGMEVLRRARAAYPFTQIVLITAQGSVPEAVEAMKLGAFDFVQKPLAGPETLRGLVRRALRWRGEPPLAPVRDPLVAGPAVPRHGASAFGRLHRELRRRRVYRTAAAYAAGGFAVLQGAELILPALPRSDWTYPFLVATVVTGFPVALCLGWIYDIGWRGVRRTGTLDENET